MEEYKLNFLEKKLVDEMLTHARRSIEYGEYCDYDEDLADDFVCEAENFSKGERLLSINEKEVLKVLNAKVRQDYLVAVEGNLNSMLSSLKEMVLNINDQWEDERNERLTEIKEKEAKAAALKKRRALESKFLKSLSPAQKKMHQDLKEIK